MEPPVKLPQDRRRQEHLRKQIPMESRKYASFKVRWRLQGISQPKKWVNLEFMFGILTIFVQAKKIRSSDVTSFGRAMWVVRIPVVLGPISPFFFFAFREGVKVEDPKKPTVVFVGRQKIMQWRLKKRPLETFRYM